MYSGNKKLRSLTCDVQNEEFFRNRSASLSSPVTKEFHYQEVHQAGGGTLIRSVSCGLTYGQDSRGQVYKTARVHVASFVSPDRRLKRLQDTERRQRTPPLSLPKSSSKKIAKKSLNFDEKAKASIVVTESRKYLGICLSVAAYILLPVFLAMVCWYFYLHMPYCSQKWNTTKTVAHMRELLYGQEETINLLEYHLSETIDNYDPLILLFTGYTGVGKTYASSIISSNFPWRSNRRLIYGRLNSEAHTLSLCGVNLVIIDDYALRDVIKTIKLIKSYLEDAKSYNKRVVIIVIFTIPSEEVSTQLVNIFEQARVNIKLIPFKILSEEAVRSCFRYEFMKRNLSLDVVNDFDALVSTQMVKTESFPGSIGCKDIQEKVSNYVDK